MAKDREKKEILRLQSIAEIVESTITNYPNDEMLHRSLQQIKDKISRITKQMQPRRMSS